MLNQTLIGFIKKELRQTVRDPRMRALLIAGPLIQLTLFGYALSTEIKHIRLAVIASPDDTMARAVEARAYAGKWFIPAKFPPDADPYQMLLAGKADAVFIAPPEGLGRSLSRQGAGAESAQLLIDATNSTKAQSVQNYFNAVLQAGLKEKGRGLSGQAPHIDFSVRMLYNPSMETTYFMVPGVLAMLLLLVTMTLTSSSITREKELGTFETLISAPVSRWEIILGKTLPYVFIGLLDMPLIIIFARVVFGVPVASTQWWWQLPLGGLVFICATVGIGTLISTAARNQQQAMMSGFFITFPAQMLSGIMYPLDNMPFWIYWITYLNPLRYFVTLMRNITLKGGDLVVFWMNVWPMALIAILTVGISFYRFRQRLN